MGNKSFDSKLLKILFDNLEISSLTMDKLQKIKLEIIDALEAENIVTPCLCPQCEADHNLNFSVKVHPWGLEVK